MFLKKGKKKKEGGGRGCVVDAGSSGGPWIK